MTEQKITANIWCNGNAEEVGAFYADAFGEVPGGASSTVESRYPDGGPGLLDFQRPLAGKPLTVDVRIAGTRVVLINAGPEFTPNPSISYMVNFDPTFWPDAPDSEQAARAALDVVWNRLVDGGSVLMPLGEYPFSKHYGWVIDKFGMSWQLMLTDPAGDPRPFLMPSLLFSGRAQNRAAEAVDYYLEVLSAAGSDAALGNRVPYPTDTGPATAGAVMFSDFRVGDQWFVAMDSGAAQPVDFGCGVSLEIACRDQAEIDSLWGALSAVSEAEQCGWLADRWGVSWQVVPAAMGELMERPGAYEKMMQMKKIVIDDF